MKHGPHQHREVASLLTQADAEQRIATGVMDAVGYLPAAFAAFVFTEHSKYTPVAKDAVGRDFT